IPELQRTIGIEAGWIRPFISGALLLLVILYLPGGLSGLIPRRRRVAKSLHGSSPAPAQPDLPQRGTLLVELDSIGKSYGGVDAVQNVDLQLNAGEILGLIGPNGAGK